MAGKGTPAAIEVEGGPQLRKAFRKLGDRCDDLKFIHKEIAEDVRDTARDLVPVVSGRLRKALRGSATKKGAYVFAGGRGVPYAGPIHFGWRARNIEPQPFLYEALDDRREDVARRYADGVGKLVKKFDGDAPR